MSTKKKKQITYLRKSKSTWLFMSKKPTYYCFSLTKNYRQRPKYAKLLEHPFVVKSALSPISVGAWYASLPIVGHSAQSKAACVSTASHAVNARSNGVESPVTPQPVRNFVTSSQHWTPEQATPTPGR